MTPEAIGVIGSIAALVGAAAGSFLAVWKISQGLLDVVIDRAILRLENHLTETFDERYVMLPQRTERATHS